MRRAGTANVRAWPPGLIVRHAFLPPSLREDIEERSERLYNHWRRILRFRVTVEGPGGHHRQGYFQLRIRITLPGRDVEISRRTAENPEEAIRKAFDAAGRQVRDCLERMPHRLRMARVSERGDLGGSFARSRTRQ